MNSGICTWFTHNYVSTCCAQEIDAVVTVLGTARLTLKKMYNRSVACRLRHRSSRSRNEIHRRPGPGDRSQADQCRPSSTGPGRTRRLKKQTIGKLTRIARAPLLESRVYALIHAQMASERECSIFCHFYKHTSKFKCTRTRVSDACSHVHHGIGPDY